MMLIMHVNNAWGNSKAETCRGVCYKNGSPGKTTGQIYVKQSVDEYKKNDLWCIQDNILQLILKHIFLWL